MPILNLDNQEEVSRYENFIKSSPHGNLMQSIHWAHVKDNWDRDYVYVENAQGEIEGAMSIISVKNDGEHAFLYSPRGPVCNLNDMDTVNKLIKEAQPVVDKHKGFLLRFDPETLYDEELYDKLKNNIIAENFSVRSRNLNDEHAFSNPRNHMIFDINDRTPEEIMSDFKSKRRSALRKTYREGVETKRIKFQDTEFDSALDTFYELTEIMAKRQGISYRPKEYFVRLFEAFEDTILYEATHEGDVLASCIVVFYNKKAFYIYAASSDNKRKLDAPRQLILEGINDTANLGMQEFDLGGVFDTTNKDGLYNFKNWFTGEEGLKEFIGEIDIIYDQELYDDFVKK